MNKRIVAILKNIFAMVLIAALLVVIFYQNRDRVLSSVFDKSPASSQKDRSETTAYRGNSDGDAYTLSEDVCYITTGYYGIISPSGKTKGREIALSEPKLWCEGDYTIRYDKAAKEAVVSKKERECYVIKTDNRIMRAKVNRNGYSVIATEKEGYSSEIKVYNRVGEAVFKWDISKSEFLDADINCDNNLIAVSVSAVKNKEVSGEISYIDITDAKIKNTSAYPGELFYSVDFNRNGTSIAVGSERTAYFNADGKVKWTYKYNDRALLKADVSEPNTIVLAFSAKGSGIKGNKTEIEVINRLGKLTGSTSIDGIADDVTVKNAEIAASFGKKIYIFDSELNEKETVKSESGIKKAVFFNDEKHLFVIDNSGGKILER